MTTEQKKAAAAQKARDRRAADKAKKEQPMVVANTHPLPESMATTEDPRDARIAELTKECLEHRRELSKLTVLSPEQALPSFEEVQPGLRWVRSTRTPYLRHEEVISHGEDSGYDNNGSLRVLAAVDRALTKLYVGADKASHIFDPNKMPPFDANVRIRVVVEVLDADTPHE